MTEQLAQLSNKKRRRPTLAQEAKIKAAEEEAARQKRQVQVDQELKTARTSDEHEHVLPRWISNRDYIDKVMSQGQRCCRLCHVELAPARDEDDGKDKVCTTMYLGDPFSRWRCFLDLCVDCLNNPTKKELSRIHGMANVQGVLPVQTTWDDEKMMIQRRATKEIKEARLCSFQRSPSDPYECRYLTMLRNHDNGAHMPHVAVWVQYEETDSGQYLYKPIEVHEIRRMNPHLPPFRWRFLHGIRPEDVLSRIQLKHLIEPDEHLMTKLLGAFAYYDAFLLPRKRKEKA